MNFLNQNIRYLRKLRHWTQDDLARHLEVKRSVIGSYEEGRAVPKIPVMQLISGTFELSIDDLINKNLSIDEPSSLDITGRSLRVLSTIVDQDNQEMVTVVPVKASAGYLNGYADPEFMQQLPRFNMPVAELSQERSYRVFQIKGDSMIPVPSGSYIFCEYAPNWNEIKDGQAYVLLTDNEGIVYKRLFNKINENNSILLKSDNPEYDPYEVPIESVSEVWKALGYLSFNLPESSDIDMQNLASMVMGIKKDLGELKQKL